MLLSGLPGVSVCTALHGPLGLKVSQATLLPSWAIASIGPVGLLRNV